MNVDRDATYLVTGGAGFIGSNLTETLVDGGANVRVLDDFSTGRRENLARVEERIQLVEGSVTERAICEEACRDVDYVLHEAAVPSVQRSVADPLTTHEADATGTLNMLLAARDAGVRRFVYAGSSSAYGDTPELPKTESMATNPRSPYAAAKLLGEHYTRIFSDIYDLETVVLRYFNIFGPRQDPASQYSAVIPIFITHALEERRPTINGDGGQTRDFTYIANAVQANLLACTAEADAVSGKTFNVGCGDRISVQRLWEEVRGITGTAAEAEHGPPRPGDVRDSLADLTQIRNAMGYKVRVDLNEGLRRTVEWFEGLST